MRIGIVLSNVPSFSETFFNNLITGLKKNGHSVEVYAKNHKKDKYDYNVIEPFPISRNKLFLIIRLFKIFFWMHFTRWNVTRRYFDLLKDNNIHGFRSIKLFYLNSHILSRNLDWLYFGFATMAVNRELVAQAIGAKMAVSIRGYDISLYPLDKPDCYQLTWKYMTKLHYLSKALLNEAKKYGFENSCESVQIAPSVDIKRFTPDHILMPENKTIKIITVARLHWQKGLEYAVLAMKELKISGVPFQYDIIGEGKEFEYLCYMINDLGLGDDVNILGARLNEEIPEILKVYNIFLMTSVQEGFCNSVLEAQSIGLLCIATNVQGLPENVVDNKTGWIVNNRDPIAISNQIIKVYNLPEEEKNRIKQTARTRIENEFNIDDQIMKWKAFFSE